MSKQRLFSKGWWGRTETPRWVLAFGAIFTILANLAVSIYVEKDKREDNYRLEQVRLLLDDMAKYQGAVAAFATEATEKKQVSSETRAALIKNLNDQFSHSREVEPLVPADREKLAALRNDIDNLITILPDRFDRESMLRFWSAVGKITQIKNKLNTSLQRNI